jgi:DEAD/DEAH box helicase domain-containing protein
VLSTAATTLTLAPDAAGVVGSGGAAPTGGAGSGLSDVRPELSRPRFDAGIHALEHLVVGVLPALLANDRYDVGSHSWIGADGAAVIAIFDRRPGSGFAAGAYERADVWLGIARERIEACGCGNGCPACILVAGCGSSRPLDKSTARRLLAGVIPIGTPKR